MPKRQQETTWSDIKCDTLGLNLVHLCLGSNQGSANLLQAAIHLTSTEWEMILQSLDLRTFRGSQHGFSWIVLSKNMTIPVSTFFVQDVPFTSLGYFYFLDYRRTGTISQTKGIKRYPTCDIIWQSFRCNRTTHLWEQLSDPSNLLSPLQIKNDFKAPLDIVRHGISSLQPFQFMWDKPLYTGCAFVNRFPSTPWILTIRLSKLCCSSWDVDITFCDFWIASGWGTRKYQWCETSRPNHYFGMIPWKYIHVPADSSSSGFGCTSLFE